MNLDTYLPRVAAHLTEIYYPDGTLAGRSRVITCPYCRLEHRHGTSLGHRASHCDLHVPKRYQQVDPRDARDNPGYLLCEPTDDANWQVEYLCGQLRVLRNRYRRILAEYQRAEPIFAREKRAHQALSKELDSIATVLGKAGVAL